MSTALSLEERVAKLELAIERLMSRTPMQPGRDDWRKVVGMFPADDPVMKQIHEEGRKIREADRERARRGELEEGE